MSKFPLKIAIVTSSLGGGGAQKSSANLSFVLSKLGHKIHVISTLNIIDYEIKGKLLNLGILKDNNDSIWGRIKRFWLFYNYLQTEQFDYIIDSRARPTFFKQFLINKLLYANQNVIYVIHSSFLSNYFPSSKFLARLLYTKAVSIACVSKAVHNLVSEKYEFKNIRTVYNALPPVQSIQSEEIIDLPQNFILFFGRIDDSVKNISLLLDAYKRSNLKQNNIHLIVLGDGPDVFKLKTKTHKNELSNVVHFIPYTDRPDSIISKAVFSTLTSKFEGFPMVIIESLALGVPVVSVDCVAGPNEIISHKSNGLLVENHNPIALSQAFNLMIEDHILYNRCRKNAKTSVDKFSIDQISKIWANILSEN